MYVCVFTNCVGGPQADPGLLLNMPLSGSWLFNGLQLHLICGLRVHWDLRLRDCRWMPGLAVFFSVSPTAESQCGDRGRMRRAGI